MRTNDGPKIACSVVAIHATPDPGFPLSYALVLVAGQDGTSLYLAADFELPWLTRAMYGKQGVYLHPDGLVSGRRLEGLALLDVGVITDPINQED
jgi:hypothetical protein